jgi:hypothetical protein
MKLIHVVLFIISFVVGCFFVYISPIEHKTVLVYPTPTNVKKIQYKDSANECFNFTAKIVSCKGKDVKEIPIQ